MTSRHLRYSYLALTAALIAGSAFAVQSSRLDARAMPLTPHSLPVDTTDRMSLPAEQVYKNIVTLKGISARELMGTMSFMSSALGVRCSYCHAQGDFSLDTKPAKKTSRAMISMTQEINAKNFSGTTVTCYTCHRGSPMPLASPSLAQGPWQGFDLVDPSGIKVDSSMTLDAVLKRYADALGGEQALKKITSRVTKANETGTGGASSTVETYQRASGLFRGVTTSSDPKREPSIDLYDGRSTWAFSGNRPPFSPDNAELEEVLRMTEFFPATNLQSSFSSVKLLGREHIGDHDYYVVSATREKSRDRLYFDAATGLLVRRYVEFETVLGPIPFSIEYSDYRDADGVKVPNSMKWTTARDSWTDVITQIRHNVSIPDSMFTKPKAP